MDMQKINHLYSVSNRFSSTRLTLNYYILMERYFEDEFKDSSYAPITAYIEEISAIVKGFLLNDGGLEKKDQYLARTEQLRTEITARMEALTIYTDHFQNFEYILNRIEYRYENSAINLPGSDEEMTDELMAFIFNEENHALVNLRIQSVIGQLPLRMTRQKFYSLLMDGLSVYKEASKKSIDSILFFLRTAAGIVRPEENQAELADLFRLLETLEQTDYKTLDGEGFRQLAGEFSQGIEKITFFSDIYLLLQEIVNDLYVMLLTCEYSHEDYMEMKVKTELIRLVMKGEFSERTDHLLVSLEGRQESLYEKYLALEGVIENLDQADPDYQTMMKIGRLLSNSSFMSLNEEPEEQAEGYLQEAAKKLIEDLDLRLKASSVILRRSIMAKVLSSLPVFFNSAAELEEHIKNCLSGCSDISEKYASMILLKELIETDELV